MICLKCGASIGEGLGLCEKCLQARTSTTHSPTPVDPDESPLSTLQNIKRWLTNLWESPEYALNIAGGVFIIVFLYLFFHGAGYSSTSSSDFQRPPGVLVPEEPLQTPTTVSSWKHDGWNFKPLAAFSIRARVLVKAKFTLAGGSDISPYDFTLGWGPMSDTAILKKLSFTHGFRMVFWNSENWPISPEETNRHTSNLHAIPSSPEIWRALGKIKFEDIIRFEGFLVSATTNDGGYWNSSTSREDEGNGACEVMWINKVTVE